MRLCRYDDDRLGVICGQVVRDITDPAGIGQVVPGDKMRVESPQIGAREIAVRQQAVGS